MDREEEFKKDIVVELTRYILVEGVNRRASDVFVEPLDDKTRVRFRIDGILHKFISFPLHLYLKVLTRIKVMGGLDVSEHRLPQDEIGRAHV